MAALDALKDDSSVKGDTIGKIRGLLKQALKGKTFFGLCCEALFRLCESMAWNLQSTKTSALGALECTNVLKNNRTER